MKSTTIFLEFEKDPLFNLLETMDTLLAIVLTDG